MVDIRGGIATLLNQFSADATRKWWGVSGEFGIVVLSWQENKDSTARTFFSFSTGSKHTVPIDQWGPPRFVFVKQFVSGLTDHESANACIRAFAEARSASDAYAQVIDKVAPNSTRSSVQEFHATWSKDQSDKINLVIESLRLAKLGTDRELALKKIDPETFFRSDTYGLLYNADCWIRVSLNRPTYVRVRIWISAASPEVWGISIDSSPAFHQAVSAIGASDAKPVQRIIDNEQLIEMAAVFEGDLLGLISRLDTSARKHASLVEATVQTISELATTLASDANLESYPVVKDGVWAAKTKRGMIVGHTSRGDPHRLQKVVTVFNQTHGWAMRIGNGFLVENILPPEEYLMGKHDLDEASRWIGEKLAEADWNIAVHSSSYDASDWYGGNKHWSSN